MFEQQVVGVLGAAKVPHFNLIAREDNGLDRSSGSLVLVDVQATAVSNTPKLDPWLHAKLNISKASMVRGTDAGHWDI